MMVPGPKSRASNSSMRAEALPFASPGTTSNDSPSTKMLSLSARLGVGDARCASDKHDCDHTGRKTRELGHRSSPPAKVRSTELILLIALYSYSIVI
jgi:hypothetical protein